MTAPNNKSGFQKEKQLELVMLGAAQGVAHPPSFPCCCSAAVFSQMLLGFGILSYYSMLRSKKLFKSQNTDSTKCGSSCLAYDLYHVFIFRVGREGDGQVVVLRYQIRKRAERSQSMSKRLA